MKKASKLISILLALVMCFSFIAPALAADLDTAGGTAETPVVLNVAPATFSVTIPTGLHIDVDGAGNVEAATEAKIINNSHGPVKVVDMTIAAADGWTIANYDLDLRNEKVDSNQIGMVINNCQTTGANAIAFNAANFNTMLAKNDADSDECAIIYSAKVTPLSEAFANGTVANVVFTIDWDEVVTRIPISVVATNSEGTDLNATANAIVGPEQTDLLDKLEQSGLVDSADDVDALIEVESDDFDDFATTTFDVSEIAQEGDSVVILHFNEETQEWEYVSEETVDADGKVTADFSSYSPVAFVVVKSDGSTELIGVSVYYNQPYNAIVGSNVLTVIAYADGSAEYFENGVSKQTWPAGSVALNGNTLSIGEDLTGELSDDGTVVTVGSETYALNTEEHDIYFGEEYSLTAEIDGETVTGAYIFYEDGSGEIYIDGAPSGEPAPAGSVTYGDRTIVESGETIFYVSLDGTQLIGPGFAVLTCTPTEEHPEGYIYYGEKYSVANNDAKESIIFYEDGSYSSYQNDKYSGTVPAGTAVYEKGVVTVNLDDGTQVLTVSNDGKTITTGQIELTLEESATSFTYDTSDTASRVKVENDDGSSAAYKVSSLVPTMEDLEGGALIAVDYDGNKQLEVVLSSSDGSIGESNGFVVIGNQFIIIPADNYVFDDELVFPEAGIYMISGYENASVIITIDWGNKVDPDAYPDMEPGLYETGTTNMTKSWDELIDEGTLSVTDDGVLYTFQQEGSIPSTNPSSSALVGDLVLPNDGSIKAIGDRYDDDGEINLLTMLLGDLNAFSYCSGLTGLVMPDSVTSISPVAFAYASLSSVRLSNNLDEIPFATFLMCSDLKECRLPDSIQTIGTWAFAYTGLTTIDLSNNVKTINEGAFGYCDQLTQLHIPASVTFLEQSVLSGDSAISSLTVDTSNTLYCAIDNVIYTKDMTELVWYMPTKPNSAFVVPESVTVIEPWAVANSSSLTSITLPDGLKEIGSYAFEACGLTSITIPDTVTDVGNSAFAANRQLISATLSGGLTEIPDSMFHSCEQLQSIHIPFGVLSIGPYAFNGCSVLSSVSIPESVVTISNDAFNKCKKLTNITIPDSVEVIGERAFQFCSKLATVDIGSSVSSIGAWAFDECHELSTIVIPNGVTVIEEGTFESCGKLQSVVIPQSMLEICDTAFYCDYKLETIYFAGTEEQWNNITFGLDWDGGVGESTTNRTYNIVYNYTGE